MAAPESRHEQIAVAIVGLLETIAAGDDFHYTPNRVVRTSLFTDDPFSEDIGQSVYFLHPGEEEYFEESTGDASSGGGVRAEAEFFLVLARQHKAATENPYLEQPPTRWQVANRMVRDVVKKLFSNVTLGIPSIVQNIITDSLVVDRARTMDGWVVVELRFVVQYNFMAANP